MNPYAERRARLIAQMHAKGGGVAILGTAPEAQRNSDADYPYRHDSSFYYLTGFTEPGAVVVLVAGAVNQSILFCRDKNPEREIWDGFRYGPEQARTTFGFDTAHCIDAIDTVIPDLLANVPALFYALAKNAVIDAQVQTWLHKVRAKSRTGITAPTASHDITGMLNEMRLMKDAREIAIMRRAADISSGAHARAMRETAPGLREYQIEAELLHEFRRHGSDFPAYTSIVATGANACVLHYRAGSAVVQNEDLILIDAGCELDGYASDITRTYPASGRFSPAQKTLYQIVLDAQQAAFAATGPGKRFMDGHDAAVRVLAQGMLDTGLLDASKVGTLDDVIASGVYRQFYMHRTGHWLGMDVHDVGGYHELGEAANNTTNSGDKPSRILHPGMTLTVEPGLYVRPAPGVPEQFWHIGIRIEDDVAITDSGIDILSTAPKTIAEIEAVMAR